MCNVRAIVSSRDGDPVLGSKELYACHPVLRSCDALVLANRQPKEGG